MSGFFILRTFTQKIPFMKCLLALFLLFSVAVSGQIKVFLKDRDTDQPIPYANLWRDNQIVASSDSLGYFYVKEGNPRTLYKISALGYETLDPIPIPETATILMAKNVIQLGNVTLKRARNNKKFKIGKLKNGDVGIVCTREALVPMVAKYFPNDGKQPLYLDRLKIKALSSEKNRIVAIAFYSAGENGKPDEPIYTQNIICRFKKGHHVAEVDLKDLAVPFPENGIFVMVNFLQLEQNKQFGPTNKDWFFYEPSLDAVSNPETPDYWFFGKNGWEQSIKTSLSMQLTVTD